jgi:hypothetical protein
MLLAMKRCCWGGHLFASNVGVLPTEHAICTLDPRLILSVPTRDLGRKLSRRRRRLRRELRRCDCDITSLVPTTDTCTQRR